MKDSNPQPQTTKPRIVIPDISVCKKCDSTSVLADCYGEPIDGDICLGCGAPTFELLGRVK